MSQGGGTRLPPDSGTAAAARDPWEGTHLYHLLLADWEQLRVLPGHAKLRHMHAPYYNLQQRSEWCCKSGTPEP